MSLKEIEIFIDLANTQNMLITAKNLNISQSAVSLSIKSLEKKLKTKLFDRIGKKIVLNENGRSFLNYVQTPFCKIKDSINLFRDELNAEIRVAVSKTVGNYFLPPILFKFLNSYPKIAIKKEITNSTNIVEKVSEAKIDIGLIEMEIDEANIKKELITTDRLVIVSKDKIDECFIDNLLDKKWILREKGSGTREIFLKEIGKFKNSLNIFVECNDFEEIKEFLNFKNTITCISEYAVKKEIKKGELFEIKVKNLNLKRNFYIIYHKDKYISKSLKVFIEFLKS